MILEMRRDRDGIWAFGGRAFFSHTFSVFGVSTVWGGPAPPENCRCMVIPVSL